MCWDVGEVGRDFGGVVKCWGRCEKVCWDVGSKGRSEKVLGGSSKMCWGMGKCVREVLGEVWGSVWMLGR